jgi:hypothetical protein
MSIPRPRVEVTGSDDGSGKHDVSVVISRDNKAHSYTGTGGSRDEATGKAVQRIIDDSRTLEWLP